MRTPSMIEVILQVSLYNNSTTEKTGMEHFDKNHQITMKTHTIFSKKRSLSRMFLQITQYSEYTQMMYSMYPCSKEEYSDMKHYKNTKQQNDRQVLFM